jgi:hypothetical protein
MVHKAAEYRTPADECLRLMKQMDQEEHREMLFGMAQTWLKMAEERELIIDKKSDAAE